MLLRLEIENFGSVAERQVLDLPVAANARDTGGLFASPLPDLRVPCVAVIYGPNASGKTTVLRALAALRHFILHSFAAKPDDRIVVDPFRSADAPPTTIRAEFVGAIGTDLPCRCSYVLSVAHAPGSAANQVLVESLSHAPQGRPRRLFDRQRGRIKGSAAFALSDNDPRLGSVRPNASLIATLAQFNHAPSLTIVEALRSVQANLFLHRYQFSDEEATRHYASNPPVLERLNEWLPRLDIGVRAARLVPGQDGPIAIFDHEGLAAPLPLFRESGGTQQFVRLFPLLDTALETGGMAVIDELDAELHPALLPEIVRWFRDPVRNPHDAQLLATCQNPYLLEHLDKMEVWFTEKDMFGRTHLRGLRDVQGVRPTDNFYRKYMDGALGALPHLG